MANNLLLLAKFSKPSFALPTLDKVKESYIHFKMTKDDSKLSNKELCAFTIQNCIEHKKDIKPVLKGFLKVHPVFNAISFLKKGKMPKKYKYLSDSDFLALLVETAYQCDKINPEINSFLTFIDFLFDCDKESWSYTKDEQLLPVNIGSLIAIVYNNGLWLDILKHDHYCIIEGVKWDTTFVTYDLYPRRMDIVKNRGYDWEELSEIQSYDTSEWLTFILNQEGTLILKTKIILPKWITNQIIKLY